MTTDLDISILKEFTKLSEDDEITMWKMMRKIFPEGRKLEELKIRYRMNNMEKKGLFIICKNSPKCFIMIKDNVVFKKIKFPDRYSNAICLRINNLWTQQELPNLKHF